MRLVPLWSARAQPALIRRMPSDTLPRHAAYCSDGPTRGYRSWPTLWPKCAVLVPLKTRNQLHVHPRLLTCLTDDGTDPFGHVTPQHFVAIRGDPDDGQVDRKGCVGTMAIVTHAPQS